MVRQPANYRNVVVRAPNALGDLIMATPAFERLAKFYGADNVTLVCLPIGGPLLAGNNWFREILPYDRKGAHKGLLGTAKFAGELRKRRFDLGFIFPNSFSSAWLFFQGRVKHRVGYYKDGRSFLLHEGRERDTDDAGNFVPKYTGQYFMELLDVMDVPPGELRPKLPIDDAERVKATEFLESKNLTGGPLVICAPGAAFGPSKLWPFDGYASVLNNLADKGAKVLISHAPNEGHEARAIIKAAGREYATTDGMDLGTLKGVFERAALVLTNDTGPRHIAVALGRPVVTIMGPNDPRYTALPEVEIGEIIREPVDCTPYTWPCQLKECPIDHRCMKAITVERVLTACHQVIC